MITDPLTPLGMPVSFLERTPIDTYFWPGVFLLAIAASSLLAIAGLLLRPQWRWAASIENAIGYRWPWLGAIATGSVLLAFEIIELFMVPFHPVMHPLLIAGSVAIIGLTLTSSTGTICALKTGHGRRSDSTSFPVPVHAEDAAGNRRS